MRVQNVFASLDAAPDTIRNLSVQGYEQAKKFLHDKKWNILKMIILISGQWTRENFDILYNYVQLLQS